jgi:hypothetical protein
MPLVKEPYNAVLREKRPLDVSLEQREYIQDILSIACSDSRFAQKAYAAIMRVLEGAPEEPSVPEPKRGRPDQELPSKPEFPSHPDTKPPLVSGPRPDNPLPEHPEPKGRK